MKSLMKKPRPGTFKAVCRQSRWVTPDVLGDVDPDSTQSRWDKKLRCNVFLVQCALETTDREEFQRHMVQAHDGGLYRWENASLSPATVDRLVRTYKSRGEDIEKGWSTPRGTDEGRPFRASSKDLAARLTTCDGCGLVMESDHTHESELWIREHLTHCAERAVA